MKTTSYLLMVLMAGMLALAGCGKSSKTPPPVVAPVYDMTKLMAAFPSPSDEIHASLNKVKFGTRYRQYDVALAELEKMAQLPDLTDAQKQAISEKAEQLKQVIEAAAAKPPQ